MRPFRWAWPPRSPRPGVPPAGASGLRPCRCVARGRRADRGPGAPRAPPPFGGLWPPPPRS